MTAVLPLNVRAALIRALHPPVRDPRFWLVQGLVIVIALFHEGADATSFLHPFGIPNFAAVALFLATIYFAFVWVAPWERPETLPTALFLAANFYLVSRVRTQPLWFAAILLLTVWQSFVRSDVPLSLGLAFLLFSLSAQGQRVFGRRALGFCCGLAMVGIPLGIQAWLKYVLFPHATYPADTAVFQLLNNFQPRSLEPFLIALVPWALIVALAIRFRESLDPLDWLAILASCIYLPMWLCV